jgi:hypothetical protein
MQDNFEKKLNKHKKKRDVIRARYNTIAIEQLTSIEDEPEHKKAYEPNVFTGDLVYYSYNYDSHLTGSNKGVVISARWKVIAIGQVYSKKLSTWVPDYACIPEAEVFFDNGQITFVDMKWLAKIA